MPKDSSRKTARKPKKAASAESIARLADAGKNISSFFTNHGRMMKPIQRVKSDLSPYFACGAESNEA
jgi:hypothetical protein